MTRKGEVGSATSLSRGVEPVLPVVSILMLAEFRSTSPPPPRVTPPGSCLPVVPHAGPAGGCGAATKPQSGAGPGLVASSVQGAPCAFQPAHVGDDDEGACVLGLVQFLYVNVKTRRSLCSIPAQSGLYGRGACTITTIIMIA